jgi:putative phosphoribosyl transferase
MDVMVPVSGHELPGILQVPETVAGVVLFAHGTGSSRLSPRNAQVAGALRAAGMATLLFDLLTPQEALDRSNVFDIPLLAGRLREAGTWARADSAAAGLPMGLFGASTGAAAALVAAAAMPGEVAAVVSRGGRPDLAGAALDHVRAATLLIVGSRDDVVLELNRSAASRLHCEHQIAIVPGATHLFEEAGALERVAELAVAWFEPRLT